MVEENDLMRERKRKIDELRELGINPYPHSYKPTHIAEGIRKSYANLGNGERSGETAKIAGRIRAIRDMGKVNFIDVEDLSGRVQLHFETGKLGDCFRLLKYLDLGDIVGAEGEVFRTKRGEISIDVTDYRILCKSVRPLPDDHYGLKDPEFKYRHRSIDLIMNPEVRAVFVKRTKAVAAMREFLDSKGFLEVETPLLQSIYGGASARPFVTELNALRIPLYLSISPELYLKRLIVGGVDRVYTICKNFRNEGIDATHNPEFTMMECYMAFADYNDMMELTEQMYAHIFNRVLGTTKIEFQGVQLDFTPPWRRARMYDLVKEHTGIDVSKMSKDEIAGEIERRSIKEITATEEDTKGTLVQELFEIFCEPKLIQPTFVIDHPRESTPLCKRHREDPELIERFEPFVCGMEIGNAYSELNDPVLQRQLLEEQERYKEEGDEEAQRVDEEFLRAIEWGMPTTGGLGLGVDRMVMLMTDSKTIKDVIYFPFMRPNDK